MGIAATPAQTSVQRLGQVRPGSGRAPRGARAERGLAGLRPRGVGEILDTAFDLFARRFAACAGFAALLWLPAKLLEYAFLEVGKGEIAPILFAVPLVVETVTIAFVSRLVSEELRGRPVPVGEAFARGLPRVPGLLAIGVFTGLVTAFAWICCFCTVFAVPMALLWLFSVAPAVYALERVSAFGALERSVRLVRPSFPRWAGWFLIAKVMIAPMTVLAVGVDAPEFRVPIQSRFPLGDGPYLVLAAALTSLFMGVATAYSAVAATVYYVDTRVRSEGLDLLLRLERMNLAKGREEGGA